MSCTVMEEPAQSVRKPLGSTTMTFTPNGAVSARNTRLKPSIANLAAWYEAIPGEPPTRPPTDEICMTRAAALLPKGRDRRFGDVVDAPEVGLELGAEVLVVGGLDG